jgi:hypothetical protein
MDEEGKRFEQLKSNQDGKRQKMKERHQKADMDNYDMNLPHEDSEDWEENDELRVDQLIVDQSDLAGAKNDGKEGANDDKNGAKNDGHGDGGEGKNMIGQDGNGDGSEGHDGKGNGHDGRRDGNHVERGGGHGEENSDGKGKGSAGRNGNGEGRASEERDGRRSGRDGAKRVSVSNASGRDGSVTGASMGVTARTSLALTTPPESVLNRPISSGTGLYNVVMSVKGGPINCGPK